MADVYLAVQSGPMGFAKLVVQKRIRGPADRRADRGRRLLAEGRLLARLSHPNLVQVLDLGWDERGPFVVVEYLSGETLSTIAREFGSIGRPIPWPMVTQIAAGLAAGLAASHGACDVDGQPDPILHRDLTPSNVIVCYSGAVKIIDFGIAKHAADAGETQAGLVKGKVAYLAPELLRGGAADPRSDLFQLGVLLFEALTGQRLFEAPDNASRVQAVLHRPIPVPGRIASGLPPALDRIVLGLLARDPTQRTASADQLCCELEDVIRQNRAHVSEHALGEWLRTALPHQFSERVARERECLRVLAGADRPAQASAGDEAAGVSRSARRRLGAAAAAFAVAVIGMTAISGSEPPAGQGDVPAELVGWPAPVVVPLAQAVSDPAPVSVRETDLSRSTPASGHGIACRRQERALRSVRPPAARCPNRSVVSRSDREQTPSKDGETAPQKPSPMDDLLPWNP